MRTRTLGYLLIASRTSHAISNDLPVAVAKESSGSPLPSLPSRRQAHRAPDVDMAASSNIYTACSATAFAAASFFCGGFFCGRWASHDLIS